MGTVNKHERMVEYIGDECAAIAGKVLQFNASRNDVDGVAFITEYGDKVEKRYLSGDNKAYGFAIVISARYSYDTDDLNLIAMSMSQAFATWIEEQNKQKNFPDFGPDCNVTKIETLQNMPDLADVDQEALVARYMLHCKVSYYEKRGIRA